MSQYTVTVTFEALDKDEAEAFVSMMSSTYPSMTSDDVEPVCECSVFWLSPGGIEYDQPRYDRVRVTTGEDECPVHRPEGSNLRRVYTLDVPLAYVQVGRSGVHADSIDAGKVTLWAEVPEIEGMACLLTPAEAVTLGEALIAVGQSTPARPEERR